MAFLQCSKTPAGFGEYVWNNPDDLVEVPDEHAVQILAIPDAGFSEVIDFAPAPTPEPEPADDDAEPETDVTEGDPEVQDASA